MQIRIVGLPPDADPNVEHRIKFVEIKDDSVVYRYVGSEPHTEPTPGKLVKGEQDESK